MPDLPGGVTTVSAHLGPDDRHLLDLLRRRAREGDRSLSREVTRTLRDALLDENGGPARTPELRNGQRHGLHSD